MSLWPHRQVQTSGPWTPMTWGDSYSFSQLGTRHLATHLAVRSTHWFNTTTETKQGAYLCPKCFTVYRPWAGAALFSGSRDSWYLYLMKFPTTNDQELLTACTSVVDSIAHKLSQSDNPHADLLQYVNTVLSQAQPLPYFGQYTVDPANIADIQQRNAQGKRRPATDPNTQAKIYRFQGCPYVYDAETAKILDAEDVHRLIGLIFCKVCLTRFMQLAFKSRRPNEVHHRSN